MLMANLMEAISQLRVPILKWKISMISYFLEYYYIELCGFSFEMIFS